MILGDLDRLHSVMPMAIMTKMVTKVAPTSDQVAISYSCRGRGVGPGVVVTRETTGLSVGVGVGRKQHFFLYV